MTINQRILDLIKVLNITQKDFARKADIQETTLSSLKKNKYEPSAQTMVKICQVFNVNTNWLLLGKGDIFNTENKEPTLSYTDIASLFTQLSKSPVDSKIIKTFLEAGLDEKRKEELLRKLEELRDK